MKMIPLLALMGLGLPSPSTAPPRTWHLEESLPPGGVEAAAREFLQNHSDLIPLDVGTLRLVQVVKSGESPSPFGQRGLTLRFSPHAEGVTVLNRALVLRVDPRGQVVLLRHNLTPLPPLQWDLDEAAARATLNPRIDTTTLTGAEKVGWTRGPFTRSAWRFTTQDGRTDFYVDATSGVLLATEERWVEMAPLGATYPRNPWYEDEIQKVELPGDVENTLGGDDFVMYRCVDRGDLYPYKDTAGQTWQSHICSVEAAPGPVDGDYLYEAIPFADDPPRDEDLFVGPHTWWHVNKIYDYFHHLGVDQLAGSPIGVVTNVRWPDAIPEGALEDPLAPLSVLDNAYFSPPYTKSDGTAVHGSLVFGQGTVSDFAYDADVIYHEFTHVVVQTLDGPRGIYADVYGLQVEPSALNEGFADYFSSAMMGDPVVGEYAGLRWEPQGGGIRDLSIPAYCPEDLLGESHQDSLPFSTSLWAQRSALSQEDQLRFDAAIFDTLTTLLPDSNMAEAVEGVVVEVQRSLGPQIAAELQDLFDDRGASRCVRALPTTPRTLNDAPDLAYTSLTGQGAFGTEDPAPAAVQLMVEVPPGRQRITLKFLQARFKGTPLTAYGYNRVPQNLTLLAQPSVPLLNAYTVDSEGKTYITSSGARVAEVVMDEVADVLEGSRYWYEPYEVHFIVEDQPGRWYLQLANVGDGTSWVYNVYTYLAEDTNSSGCDQSGGENSAGGFMVAGWVLSRRRRVASR